MTPTRAWTTALLLLLGSPVLAACGARTDASGAPLAEPDDGPVRFPSGTIAVADGLGASFYPPDAVTGTPALGHLSWPADGFVRQYLAFDGSGNLYAAAYLDGNATSKPVARVDVFAAGSVGQSQAVRAIVGPTTGLLSARGILVDSTGFVYVSNGDVTGATSGVDVFAPDASGDVGPVRSIRSSAAAFWLPSGIAMNATGDALYVGNSEPGPVYVFAAADGTQAPLGSLGDTALLGDVTGVAVDSSGRNLCGGLEREPCRGVRTGRQQRRHRLHRWCGDWDQPAARRRGGPCGADWGGKRGGWRDRIRAGDAGERRARRGPGSHTGL